MALNNLFEEKGILVSPSTEDKLNVAMDDAIECEAEDVTFENGYLTVSCILNIVYITLHTLFL